MHVGYTLFSQLGNTIMVQTYIALTHHQPSHRHRRRCRMPYVITLQHDTNWERRRRRRCRRHWFSRKTFIFF